MNVPHKQILLEDVQDRLTNTSIVDKHSVFSSKKRRSTRSPKYAKVDKQDDQNDMEDQDPQKKNKKGQVQKKQAWPIWRKLFNYTLKRKFHAVMAVSMSLFYATAFSLLPLKVGQVLDLITFSTQNDSNLDELRNSMKQFTIIVIFLSLFNYLRYIVLHFLEEFLAVDMRNDFYRKFILNDLYFFEQYKSGDLVSRLSSDVNQAKSAISNNVTFMLRNVTVVISNIVVLFTISWKLALIIFMIVPIYTFMTLQYSKYNKVLVKKYQDVLAQIAASIAQKFSGIQLVKAYSTEDKEVAEYSQIINKGYFIQRKKILITGIFNSVSQFLPYIGIAVVLWYGGKMVISSNNQLTAGQLTSFIMYCITLTSATARMANSYTDIINGTYAVQKVFEMLDYVPLVNEANGANYSITGSIEFRNVVFKYPTSKTITLKNISLQIKRAEYVAFVGESGSGKSTIIKLIEKLYKIESGDIFYGEHNQNDINATCLRQQIGFVNQDATLFSGTIQENIVYGLKDYCIEDLHSAAQRAGCMEFLKTEKQFPKGFQSQVGEKGGRLSGGQRQRVSIARALMRKPKVIIFDQATSALDSNSEQMVQKSIQNLSKLSGQQKPTIIVIAHRLSTVINADRIIVMRSGNIVEMGTHRELRNLHGYYYQLIQKQLGQNPQLNSSSLLRQVETS